MLDSVDLSQKIEKEKYKKKISDLKIKLGILQREAKNLEIPTIVVFEGWDAAGKGTIINNLILALDPRGFKVYSLTKPNEDEKLRPFLWRFWMKLPPKGGISIFDKSWYGYILSEYIERKTKKNNWLKSFDEIAAFERQLTDDGNIIIKFFLHIDKKEQKKRFKNLEKNKSTSWRVTQEDWKHNKEYDEFFEAYSEMLKESNSENAPWEIIESKDERFATIKVYSKMIDIISKKIEEVKKLKKLKNPDKNNKVILGNIEDSILDSIDLKRILTLEEYESELEKYQKKIREVEYEIYKKRIPVVIVFEGCDAAGKGGSIKRLTSNMDPRGYEVVPIAAPGDIEKKHHHLWRFWINLPKAGHLTIFDRSWYGRVLVERIESFCSENEWKRSYQEINEMEDQLSSFGTVVIKFWLQIDQDEQLRRFHERQSNPYKNWKITEEDWRNREKWNLYKNAIDEMLFRTSTTNAPWTVVEANSKYYARIKILKTTYESIKKFL
jgi:AMP-polyphosphate phosphotransferase